MSLGGYNTNAALNVNIGALYRKDRFSAAVDVANIGDNLKFGQSSEAESQPMLVRYGVSYSFLHDKSLLCSLSGQDVPQSAVLSSYGGGIEYLLNQYLALRGGVLNQNNFIRLSSGFGVAYKHIELDSLIHPCPGRTTRAGYNPNWIVIQVWPVSARAN